MQIDRSEMKYDQFENKFFIRVPVKKNESLSYLDCYVYGYILRGPVAISSLSNNLEISNTKISKILKILKEKNLIYEKNKKIYSLTEDHKKHFLFYENNLAYDITFLPNLTFLKIQDNAVYWKLYKYSDPISGMSNCYSIGSRVNLQKINDQYIKDVLGITAGGLKRSMRKLKELKLVKIKRSGDSFYYGIQPIKQEMKEYWRSSDIWHFSRFFDQKEILKLYEENTKFYIKEE